MLDFQIFEQGRDPRSCRNSYQFRNFFRRMNRTHPLHLHALTSENRSFQQLKSLPDDRECCRITALATLSHQGRRIETYRLPTLTYFWIKRSTSQTTLESTRLMLHCCAYGLSSKLQLQTIAAMTNLNREQTKEGGALWCTLNRSWFWFKLRVHGLSKAPQTQAHGKSKKH